VHKNPKVRQEVAQVLQGVERVYLTEPLDYIPHINVMKRAHIVLTDSGGIQEEAPALGKPVLVLRDVTERPEAVAFGTARLVGANRRRVEEEVGLLLDSKEAYDAMANAVNPYGDGRAAPRIVQAVLSYWRLAPPPEEFRPA
jgi:UDP-N-acetylglucosamine 2-epimerase (non-hydrolysing)